MTSSNRNDDIMNHLQIFKPDMLVYCMNEDSKKDFNKDKKGENSKDFEKGKHPGFSQGFDKNKMEQFQKDFEKGNFEKPKNFNSLESLTKLKGKKSFFGWKI